MLKEKPGGGAKVLSPAEVPQRDGYYWIHGSTILRRGTEVESVFIVDTDSGFEQCRVSWFVSGRWFDSRDPEVWELLGGKSEIFPFAWRYSVDLAGDAHSDSALQARGSSAN